MLTDDTAGMSTSETMSPPPAQGRARGSTGRQPVLNRLHRSFDKYGPANLPMKVLMTAAAAMLLSGAVSGGSDVKMAESDVLVYCIIYCGWVICFLPDTLVHLNAYILYKLFLLFFRLFAAEIAVGLYHHVKGESDILKRGLSLRPMVGPSFQWMVEMVHSIRFVLIVGCLSASTVTHLFDRPEILVEFIDEEPIN